LSLQVLLPKEEYDATLRKERDQGQTQGFWAAVDIMLKYVEGGRIAFGPGVSDEQRSKWEKVAQALDRWKEKK
jgi:hypothetical protein